VRASFAALLLLLCLGYSATAATPKKPLDRKVAAEQALMQGRIDEAITTLQQIVSATPADGQAYLLLCRAYYAEEHPDEAVDACEHALQTLASSSEAQDWMGRAYGMKADRSGPLAGFKLAHRVVAAFEEAIRLDPANGAAVNDLGEYYISAPSVLGGGNDKAVALAERSAALLPQQAHRIQALAAEGRRDYGTAEREFRSAADTANRPEALVDLGHFYMRRKQDDDAVEALKRAIAADHARDDALVDAASILIRMHREPQLALQALNSYLAGNAKTDAAPVVKVYVMLAKIKADDGDKAGARAEYEKALQLAANYAPAKHGLLSL
jgi:tetratricopeptide (TPR) repeat protein